MAVSVTGLTGKRATRSLIIACTVLAAGCSIEPDEPGNFYQARQETLSGEPGEILRMEDFPGAPADANAWRVLYRSTGLSGEPIAVSGVILAPEEAPASGQRPVIAWAHGTTGVARRCAPSLSPKFFYASTPGLKDFLARGYVVAATDYPGLGTKGPHPYLVGISETRAVLDLVRAAARLDKAHASNMFVAWGHSQGGHAALFTGQLAASYAPELELAGVAAAAPATDLATLLRDDGQTGAGKVLAALALWSWNRVYEAPLSNLLDEEALSGVNAIAEDCLESLTQGLVLARREKVINADFLKVDITGIEPWRTLFQRNTPTGSQAGVPLYIAQGTKDTAVRPDVTRAYVEDACRAGTPVRFDPREGVDHLKIASESAVAAAQWIADRFAGTPPVDDCGKLTENGTSG